MQPHVVEWVPSSKFSFCLQVLTAVFCQTAIESAQNDQTTMVQTMLDNKHAILEKLKSLFYEIDADDVANGHVGSLTMGVFEEKMKNPEVHDFFESLGLDVWDASLGCMSRTLVATDAAGNQEVRPCCVQQQVGEVASAPP